MTSTRETEDGYPLFPLALRVSGRPCLVVGGGAVAARKAASLLEAGARLDVVAPELGPELAGDPGIGTRWRWSDRAFVPGDVEGRLLVVAATGDRETNRRVAEAARAAGSLTNVVDDPDGSDFHVPSVVQRGPLQLTVSTGGRAPAVSARLRGRLEEHFPPVWGDVVREFGTVRDAARSAGLDEGRRRELSRALADLDVERLLTEGGLARVKEAVRACTSPYSA